MGRYRHGPMGRCRPIGQERTQHVPMVRCKRTSMGCRRPGHGRRPGRGRRPERGRQPGRGRRPGRCM